MTQLSRKSLLLAIAAVALSTGGAQAEVLTIEQSVRMALEKNFDILISENARKSAEHDIDIAESEFLPTLTASSSNRFSAQSNTDSTLTSSQNETSNTQVGVSKRIDTGANVTLSTAIDRRANNNRFTTLNPSYDANLTLRVVQPLLAGFGSDVSKARRRLSEIELKQRENDFQATVIQVIASTEQAYHSLAFAIEQEKVRQAALELAIKLHEENKTKLETGIATSMDVLQAEVGVANARDRLLRATKAVSDARDRLLTFIGLDDLNLAFEAVVPKIGPNVIPEVGATFDRALANAPRYLALLDAKDRREIELKRAKRNRLPTLNLTGVYAYTGLDGTNIETGAVGSVGGAYDQLTERDSHNWQLNLNLEAPWRLQDRRAEYMKAQIQLESEEARIAREKQRIMRDARISVRNIDTLTQAIAIKELASKLSREEYQMEKAKFDAGLSTGREVLEAQQRMDEASVAELQARIDLLNAYSDLRELDGQSLTRYSVEFQ